MSWAWWQPGDTLRPQRVQICVYTGNPAGGGQVEWRRGVWGGRPFQETFSIVLNSDDQVSHSWGGEERTPQKC